MTILRRVFLVTVCLLSASTAAGQRIATLDSLIQPLVDERQIGGAVLQVKWGGRVLHRSAYGHAYRYGSDGSPVTEPVPMRPDHLFDLASLTKVLGTTFAVMQLVDAGAVDLDEPVATYLPAFAGGEKDRVTLRHLLTHTSGLTPWTPLYYEAATPEEVLLAIARRPLEFEVGGDRHYSDLGFMLLGYLVEHVSGQELDVFLSERIFRKLGLEHTMFRPLDNGIGPDRIAATSHGNPFERRMVYDDTFGYDVDVDPTSWDGWRTHSLRGEVNDGNAYYAHGGLAGHAGLFSTVDDVQALLDLLLDRGRDVLSGIVVDTFLTPDRTGNGLGWAMDPAVIAARGAPDGTFGHTGFTGTNVVVMPALDLSIILLTNRQHVDPFGSYFNLHPVRQAVVDAVLSAVQ